VNPRPIALIAALLPFLAVHLSYWVAASQGSVDWCNPYIDSCTSISATGRHPPASYVFRATMLPAAVFMMAYWWFNHAWLGSLGSAAALRHWMLGLGLLACIGLILYVTVLGESGDIWRTQRRIGTVLFFSFTYLSQLLLLAQLRGLREQLPMIPGALLHAMWFICLILLLLGLLTVILDAWNERYYARVEDAFEWVLTLLLQSNFLLGYLVWRRVGWRLRV